MQQILLHWAVILIFINLVCKLEVVYSCAGSYWNETDSTEFLSSIGKNKVCDLFLNNDEYIKLNTRSNSRHFSGYIANCLKTFTAFIIAFGVDKPKKFLYLVFKQKYRKLITFLEVVR
jgi:hypothetical protein